MATNKTNWYKLPYEIKSTLETLVSKIEDSGCFSTDKLLDIKNRVTWSNTPLILKEVNEYLEENEYPHSIESSPWYTLLTKRVSKLKDLVENFDCNNTPDTEAPTVPQNLVSSNVTSTGVKLDWDVSTDDRGVANYIIYRDGVEVATRVGNTATLSGLTPSTTYDFTVSAIDEAGNESAQSAVEQVTTLA